MTRTLTTTLVLGATALVLTGTACSVSAGTTATFPNPVTIVQKAGATPDNGEVNGSSGMDGTFKVAEGTFDYTSQPTLTVKTFKAKNALDDEVSAARGQGPQDGQGMIVSTSPPLFVVYTYGLGTGLVAAVADKIGGNVETLG